jgi:hypothetical protein
MASQDVRTQESQPNALASPQLLECAHSADRVSTSMKTESFALRDLFGQYAGAMAYVAVRSGNGDESIGSAFHVGDGVFVTARHVVEHRTITEVATTSRAEVVIKNASVVGSGPSVTTYYVEPRVLTVVEGPFFHADHSADVAVFRVGGLDNRTPRVPLGSHFDSEIEDHTFVLSEALVLGYPPIPNTNVPRLIAARAEVNAVIDTRHTPYAQFVISAIARGGFSGGLVLSEYGHALGMVTESLVTNAAPPELGFMTVLSVEPIYGCIAPYFTLSGQTDAWSFAQDCRRCIRLARSETARLNPRLASAMISLYDDDRDVCIELSSPNTECLASMYEALNAASPVEIVEGHSRPGYLLLLPKLNPPRATLERSLAAVVERLRGSGYVVVSSHPGPL